jgi:diacylglycerol kinase (ATP)
MKVLFILNGSKRQSTSFKNRISKKLPSNIDFNFSCTNYRGHATEITKDNADKFNVIVPIGGDGTISECVNGMMQFSSQNPDKTLPILLPVAVGSGNDFVRNFAWKHNVDSVLDRIQNLKTNSVDIAHIRFQNGDTTFFNNAASAGFGPAVVKITETLPSVWPGNLKFGLAILAAFFTYRKKNIQVIGDDFSWTGKAMIAVVAKGKFFGSGIGIAPDAELDDGFLHVTIIGDVSLLDYLKQLKKLKQCKKINHKEVFYFKSKQVNFTSNSLLETDGELKLQAHCAFTLKSRAIKFA